MLIKATQESGWSKRVNAIQSPATMFALGGRQSPIHNGIGQTVPFCNEGQWRVLRGVP
jgi:hypothetical protein